MQQLQGVFKSLFARCELFGSIRILLDFYVLIDINVYTSFNDETKSAIMSNLSQEECNLHVIATTAFSMRIDILNIYQIIHWGLSANLEQYVQEVGRARRDGKDSSAILKFNKANEFTQQAIKLYAENKTKYRRPKLFNNFIKYTHSTAHVMLIVNLWVE